MILYHIAPETAVGAASCARQLKGYRQCIAFPGLSIRATAVVVEGCDSFRVTPSADHVVLSTGRVVVSVSRLTNDLSKHLLATYDPNDLMVEVSTDPEFELAVGRRDSDRSPHYGGAWLSDPLCSTAFAWRFDAKPALVTAGHCIPNGGRVWSGLGNYMGSVPARTFENWDIGKGTVGVRGFSGYRGDGAVIVLRSGVTSTARVYRGGTTSADSAVVLGMSARRARYGESFCTSGTKSGEICGWEVFRTRFDYRFEDGEVLRNAVRSWGKQGWCARRGDSGGAVFVPGSAGVRARGVISAAAGGGDDHFGGFTDRCAVLFTDIYDVYEGLPGRLL